MSSYQQSSWNQPRCFLSRSRLCAESSFLFSPSLPGAARPDDFACCLPAGDPGRAHRWSRLQGWLPPGCRLCPRWWPAQAARSPDPWRTGRPPPGYRLSAHRWRWHQRDLGTLETFLGQAWFSHFSSGCVRLHSFCSAFGLSRRGRCASSYRTWRSHRARVACVPLLGASRGIRLQKTWHGTRSSWGCGGLPCSCWRCSCRPQPPWVGRRAWRQPLGTPAGQEDFRVWGGLWRPGRWPDGSSSVTSIWIREERRPLYGGMGPRWAETYWLVIGLTLEWLDLDSGPNGVTRTTRWSNHPIWWPGGAHLAPLPPQSPLPGIVNPVRACVYEAKFSNSINLNICSYPNLAPEWWCFVVSTSSSGHICKGLLSILDLCRLLSSLSSFPLLTWEHGLECVFEVFKLTVNSLYM